jgi:signal-transduction protein with cAMP-binding, CBS, and nucleotidyltransferase domain
MPRINSFPKHCWSYVANLMNMLVYEKGREIVRAGHRAIGYYTIISGSCDVISAGTDQGSLKIEEFEAGDTFGDSSFSFGTGITPHTIITNKLTELLLIEPSEIEVYLEKLKIIEKEQMRSFCASWSPFTYWNWKKENIDEFADRAEFLRFNGGEIVHDNSFKQIERIFFILKGKI